MSDSDDNIPLSVLLARAKAQRETEEKSKNAEKGNRKRKADDSDSDDDVPIAKLVKKKQTESAEKSKEAKPKTEKKAAKPAASQSTQRATVGNASSEFYEGCDKGRLVQSLLIRWWYAITWPLPSDIGVPPAGYEALVGFPGVFVSTQVSIG